MGFFVSVEIFAKKGSIVKNVKITRHANFLIYCKLSFFFFINRFQYKTSKSMIKVFPFVQRDQHVNKRCVHAASNAHTPPSMRRWSGTRDLAVLAARVTDMRISRRTLIRVAIFMFSFYMFVGFTLYRNLQWRESMINKFSQMAEHSLVTMVTS